MRRAQAEGGGCILLGGSGEMKREEGLEAALRDEDPRAQAHGAGGSPRLPSTVQQAGCLFTRPRAPGMMLIPLSPSLAQTHQLLDPQGKKYPHLPPSAVLFQGVNSVPKAREEPLC